ncbi:SAM-dependent methyltransferase [Siminovitchia sp. FSL W7-1587]|uniref:SAM-dependent methyltransferase n=1 Tax=Siminovitchia sp. FSL W7-1587 TaxID=2954699 RepID=UPI0030D25EAB
MIDYKYDKLLSIKTTGDCEGPSAHVHYHRYEPTPYAALEQLFSRYRLSKSDCFVDMGCGKGRVAFFAHHLFQVSATGVEMNPSLYESALKNQASYIKNGKLKAGIVNFRRLLAQEYDIHPSDNVFFFFNPFSVQIFMNVIHHIGLSVAQTPRKVDLILYYPSIEYVHYVINYTPFQLIDEVRVDFLYEKNDHERFLIFRWC